ncbi:MAG TPA: hypothetical protein VIW24_18610 [Aldersonia sp.]
MLTSLINEIHDGCERMSLVIEDWHLITDTATVGAGSCCTTCVPG